MSPEPAQGATNPNRRRALIGGVAMVVVIVLVAIWLGTRSDDSPSSSSPGSSPSPSPSGSTNPGSTLTPTPSSSPGGSSTAPGSPNPSDAMNSAKPQQVRFPQTGRPAKDVALSISRVETINGKGHIPGEISGPALRISLTATNNTGRRIAVNTTVANLYYGADARPASPLIESGAKPFPASIKPGQQATGIFVFTVPKNDRSQLQLEVVLGAKFRVVKFNGACPTDC